MKYGHLVTKVYKFGIKYCGEFFSYQHILETAVQSAK